MPYQVAITECQAAWSEVKRGLITVREFYSIVRAYGQHAIIGRPINNTGA